MNFLDPSSNTFLCVLETKRRVPLFTSCDFYSSKLVELLLKFCNQLNWIHHHISFTKLNLRYFWNFLIRILTFTFKCLFSLAFQTNGRVHLLILLKFISVWVDDHNLCCRTTGTLNFLSLPVHKFLTLILWVSV